MNEQLQQTINEMLQKALAAFDNGAGWLEGQIPELLQQLLLWRFTESLVYFSIGVLLLVIYVVVIYVYVYKFRPTVEVPDERVAYDFCAAAFPVLLLFLPSIALMLSNLAWLQIIIAPKFYLLEYATKLVW